MTVNDTLKALLGKWQGNCKTWFEPEKLADESMVEGEFHEVFGGRFVRHVYQAEIQGKPRCGEDLLTFNRVAKRFESSWIDDFHMNYAIMFSIGSATEHGLSVLGAYDVGQDQPQWGWRTEFALNGHDQLIITAFNISPEGIAAKAVETMYQRIK